MANKPWSHPYFLATKAKIIEACFSGDTHVLMEGGKTKQIRSIDVGEKVLSRCEFTGEMAYKRVVKTFHHRPEDVSNATIDGEIPAYMVIYSTNHPEWTKGGIHVTPEHPMWVQGKGWTAVRDLQPGDQFLTSTGATAVVEEVDRGYETYNVYNLHVEDFHTYFVSSGIWVHNTKITELKSVDPLPVRDATAKPIDNPYADQRTLTELKAATKQETEDRPRFVGAVCR